MSRQSQEFVAALESLLRTLFTVQRDAFRFRETTPLQLHVLMTLKKEHGLTMSALARHLGVRPQTVTHLVDSLQRGGWVDRTPSATDRRSHLVRVTSKGAAMLLRTEEALRRRLDRIMDRVPPASLRAATAVLRTAEESYRETATPRTRRRIPGRVRRAA